MTEDGTITVASSSAFDRAWDATLALGFEGDELCDTAVAEDLSLELRMRLNSEGYIL